MEKLTEAYQAEDGTLFVSFESARLHELKKKLVEMVHADLAQMLGPTVSRYVQEELVISSLLKFCYITIR